MHATTRPKTASALPGCGLPQERLARIAARRAFVEAKQCFALCVDALDPGAPLSAWLTQEVRRAKEPEDLWLLRNAVYAGLRRERLPLAGALRRVLETLFAERGAPSGFGDTLD
jgi:hypothetical protein